MIPGVFTILLLVRSVVTEGGLLTSCLSTDKPCVRKATEQFLNNTAKGIPQYDIRPIDPMTIAEYIDTTEGIKNTFGNLTVEGLSRLEIDDYVMDRADQHVVLKTRVSANITGDIRMEIANHDKIERPYKHQGTALLTSRYNYEIKKDASGVEHFVVGPETIECSDYVGKIDSPMDSEVPENFKLSSRDYFCKFLTIANRNFIHNIRASTKILPKNAFFEDA